jgi:hypothetical protein
MQPVEPTFFEAIASAPVLYAIATTAAAISTVLAISAYLTRRRPVRAQAYAIGAIVGSLLTTLLGVVGWAFIRDRTNETIAAILTTLSRGEVMIMRAGGYAEAKMMLYYAATIALVPLFAGVVSVFVLRRPKQRLRKVDVERRPSLRSSQLTEAHG